MSILKNINWKYILIASGLILLVIFFLRFNSKREKFNGSNVESELNTEKNAPFRDPIKDKQIGEIILYYATWCGYSRDFLPEWDKFQRYAKDNFPNLKVTSIKCENDDEEMCVQKGVDGYPTVILYPTDGTEIKYLSERTSDKLIEFVKGHLKI